MSVAPRIARCPTAAHRPALQARAGRGKQRQPHAARKHTCHGDPRRGRRRHPPHPAARRPAQRRA